MLDHGFGLTLSPEADSDAVIATLRVGEGVVGW